MAKTKGNQLYMQGKLFADPKGTNTTSGKLKCTFSLLHVHKGGDPRKDGRWFNFVAWEEIAEHILSNYRKNDIITVERASPRAGKAKCPGCAQWTEVGIEWTIYGLDEEASAPRLPDTELQDHALDGREVLIDDDDVPY